MTSPRTKKNKQMRRIISLSIMAIVSAAASAWVVSSLFKTPIKDPTVVTETTTPKNPSTINSQVVPESQATKPTPVTAKVEVYWLSGTEENAKLLAAPLEIQVKSEDKTDSLQQALETLLAGPKQSQYVTTIPQGTKLISIKQAANGVHLNFSKEFTEGGGSSDMSHRLGQVLYTATSAKTNTPVWINVEGKPLKSLGGEGLIINQPMTRKEFDENFAL